MKKISKAKGDMLPEYDFSKGVRGKYTKAYAKGSNVVMLDPDVAKVFATGKSVNGSLRNLVKTLKLLK
jgi:hypothetical protein